MTRIIPADRIEEIVGARRRKHQHLGRAVSAEATVHILHSQECRDSLDDLRECVYSRALDRGIDTRAWRHHMDCVAELAIVRGELVPAVGSNRDA
ncbi:hypothetical protein [Serinibacter salmoneus]|uniref:Uncharacterized protein n=1 Tax=Serinibacter salmoneus TaxID=556530 RepID=A0A2A9D1X3_9MICO|nr:hypothetical protein [Serinibacter salmoneus]PFG19850.1 hypothetical protein ATL40_1426 [Serinibacter salmoneus]